MMSFVGSFRKKYKTPEYHHLLYYWVKSCFNSQKIYQVFFLALNSQKLRRNSVTYGTSCRVRGYFVSFIITNFTYRTPTMPVVIWWFTVSATDLRERFLLSRDFYLTFLPASLKTSLGAGSFSLKFAGLHADLQKIAPVFTII